MGMVFWSTPLASSKAWRTLPQAKVAICLALAVFVGYPDLVQVFGDKVREQSSASVQVVIITMGVYLVISLITSGLMGLYNRRMALVER